MPAIAFHGTAEYRTRMDSGMRFAALTHDLQRSHNCKSRAVVSAELLEGHLANERHSFFCRVNDARKIVQTFSGWPHTRTTSAMTRWPIRGLRDGTITTRLGSDGLSTGDASEAPVRQVNTTPKTSHTYRGGEH